MFEKFLSSLPYNPSLIHQFTFYARRLRQEESIRRLGFIFIILAVFVQFFAVMSPPQPTMARSNNDMIDGGISSAADAASYCTHDTRHYGEVLQYYGITCADVAHALKTTIQSTAYHKNLYSLGWNPYGKKGETPVTIHGNQLYWRYLWSWDSHAYSTYHALRVNSTKTGKAYFILFNCGNLVSIGIPTPPPAPQPKPAPQPTPTPTPPSTPPPVQDICSDVPGTQTSLSQCKPCSAAQTVEDKTACLTFSKTVSNTTEHISDANSTTAKAGDILRYTLSVKNIGTVTIPAFVIQENMSDVLDYATITDMDGGALDNATKVVSWPTLDILADTTVEKHIIVQVKNPIPQTPVSTSDAGHFDLTMTNVYGNTVNVKLPPSPIKTVERVSASLPNTGPGSSLAVGFGIALVAGFFFARSRLLTREATIALHDFNTGGL